MTEAMGEVGSLVDTHAHLDEIEDIGTAIEGARRAGVVAIVAVGQDYESNLKVLDLAERYRAFVFAALGLHPWSLGTMTDAQLELNLRLVEDNMPGIVAVGEIGLDYDKRVRKSADKERQKEAFSAMLALARKHGKPVSVHSRYSWKDSLDLVKGSGVTGVVFHWYTGFSSVLREIIVEGFFISATPAAEYHDDHRRAVKEAPLEHLLLETDSPVRYGREVKFESRPADVVRTLAAVSQLRGLEPAIVARQTTKNALRLFGLPPESG